MTLCATDFLCLRQSKLGPDLAFSFTFIQTGFVYIPTRNRLSVVLNVVAGWLKVHKGLLTDAMDKQFNKEKSVFHDWVEDCSESIEQCLNNDFNNWKIRYFVYDPQDF